MPTSGQKTKPKLPDIKLSKIAGYKARAEKDREVAKVIGEWVATILVHLDGLKKALAPLGREEREYAIRDMEEEEAKAKALLQILLWRKPLLEIQETLSKKLPEKEAKKAFDKIVQDLKRLFSPFTFKDSQDVSPAVVRVAWRAFFNHQYSREFHSREELEALNIELENKKFLVKDTDGVVKNNGYAYSVSPRALFGEPEITEVSKKFNELLTKVKEREKQNLFTRSTLSMEEFLAAKSGVIALDIPPEEVLNKDNSTAFWRGGGALLLKSDGQKIIPLTALGSLRETVEEIKKTQFNSHSVHLLLDSLEQKKPPYFPDIDDPRRKIQILWYWIKRVLKQLEQHKQNQILLGQWVDNKTTTTPEDWFLKRKPGVAVANHQESWREKDLEGKILREIPDPFLLVERKEVDGVETIQIVEAPSHLKKLFAACMDKYQEQGNMFRGTPQPLKSFLQAVHRKVADVSRDAEKADQIANIK